MKKLSIVSLIGAAVLGTLALTGCPSVNSSREALIDLSSFYLRGNMNNWGNGSGSSTDLDALAKDCALTAADDGLSYTITYTAKAANDEFAIANSGWSVKYCNGTSVAVDGDEVVLEGGGDNAKVTGQIPGNNYKMTITPLAETVKVKVELAGANVPTFYLVGSNELTVFDYDGTKYTTKFDASDATEELVIYSDGKYYTSDSVTSTASALTASETKGVAKCTGLTQDSNYTFTITLSDDGTVKAKVAETNLKDVYNLAVICSNVNVVDGSACDEITWSADDEYTGTVTFKKGSIVSDWGGGVQFAVATDSDWTNKYTGAAINTPDTLTALVAGSDDNAKLTAVTDSPLAHDLVITVVTTGTEVKVKYTYSD